MGAASRRKGLAGEREVALAFEAASWHVRGLEGGGDHFTVKMVERSEEYARTAVAHIEVKRQERLRLPEWLAQAAAEAPPGVPPVLVFRQSRGRWYACLPLDDLLELIS